MLMRQLSRIVSRGQHKMDTYAGDGNEKTLKRRLEMIFDNREQQISAETSAGDYTWSVKGHPWIQRIVYDYFMGKYLDNMPNRNANAEDQTYSPNRNRQQHQKHLQTLLDAREASLRHPIFWNIKSMHESGYSFNPIKEKVVKQAKWRKKLSEVHSHKSNAQLQSDAETLLETLISRLPTPYFNKLMKVLEGFVDLESKTRGTPDWKKHRIYIISQTLMRNVSVSHSHLVALELGHYFYVEIPEQTVEEAKDGGDTTDAKASEKLDSHVIREPKELRSMGKKYEKLRDEFIQRMMEKQHEFASWNSISVSEGSTSDSCEDDDIPSDLKLCKASQREELEETLVELRRMGLRKEEEAVDMKNRQGGRPKKGEVPACRISQICTLFLTLHVSLTTQVFTCDLQQSEWRRKVDRLTLTMKRRR